MSGVLEVAEKAEALLQRLVVALATIADSSDAEFMQGHARHHLEVTALRVKEVRRGLSALARPVPAQAAGTEGELESTEVLFTFPGGSVPLPVLRDPVTGERFFLPAIAQVQHSLTHRFTPTQAAADAAGVLRVAAALVEAKQEWDLTLHGSIEERRTKAAEEQAVRDLREIGPARLRALADTLEVGA